MYGTASSGKHEFLKARGLHEAIDYTNGDWAPELMRLTGGRPSEVLGMTAAGIDRSDQSCWVYRLADHKTAHHGKARAIFIGPRAQEIILPRILKAGDQGPLFPITRDSLRTAVYRGCERAFPHPTFSAIPATELTEAYRILSDEERRAGYDSLRAAGASFQIPPAASAGSWPGGCSATKSRTRPRPVITRPAGCGGGSTSMAWASAASVSRLKSWPSSRRPSTPRSLGTGPMTRPRTRPFVSRGPLRRSNGSTH